MADFYQAIAAGEGGNPSGSKLMKGWRREALGEPLLELVGGGATVTLKWDGGSLKWNAS